MRVGARGGLWSNREFLKLWMGQTISAFGSMISGVALPVTAVLLLGAGPAEMGLLAAIGGAPVLLVGLFAGVWADRLRRRLIMISADLGRALLLGSIPVAWLLGVLRIEQLYIVAALSGVLTVFFNVADQSLLPSIVRREHLVEANSKFGTTSSVAEIGGLALGGVLVQALTAPLAIVIDALSFLFSALFIGLTRVREEPPVPEAGQTVWSDIAAGLRVVLGNPALRALAGSSATFNFFGNFIGTLYALYVIDELGVPVALYGLLVGAGGIGALLGALVAARFAARFGIGPTLAGTMLFTGLVQLTLPLAAGPALVVVAMLMVAQIIGDIAIAIYMINEASLRQSLVPERFLGRANASMSFLTGGLGPLGALLAGFVGAAIGLRATLLLALLGIMSASLWIIFSPIRRLQAPEMVAEEQAEG